MQFFASFLYKGVHEGKSLKKNLLCPFFLGLFFESSPIDIGDVELSSGMAGGLLVVGPFLGNFPRFGASVCMRGLELISRCPTWLLAFLGRDWSACGYAGRRCVRVQCGHGEMTLSPFLTRSPVHPVVMRLQSHAQLPMPCLRFLDHSGERWRLDDALGSRCVVQANTSWTTRAGSTPVRRSSSPWWL